jgi:hypothetical protein
MNIILMIVFLGTEYIIQNHKSNSEDFHIVVISIIVI